MGTGFNGDATPPVVSVVLPCLNEAESVAGCVIEAREALRASGLAAEVIVVDNGSTDGSPDLATAAGATVIHEPRPGYGQALMAGFAAARGDVIVMADADQTYDLAKVELLVRPVLDDEADIVCGGRLDGATRKTMPMLHRYIGTPALTFLISRAAGGLSLRDSQSGYRAFRRTTIRDMNLSSPGMELASEMLIKASHSGLRLLEIPIAYRARVGESKLDTISDGWRHLKTILMLAPDLLLMWPGAALVAAGVVMTVASFVEPAGIPLGSLRWQPIFFSGIATVLGVQALLSGAVLAAYSSVVSTRTRVRFSFTKSTRFLSRCEVAGAAAIAVGLAIDIALFVNWVGGADAPSVGMPLAGLAQSLIIVGASLGSFGIVSRLLIARQQRLPSSVEVSSLLVDVEPAE